VFCVCMYGLILGANLFLDRAEKIGYAMRIPAFIIGVAIVGFGTSLPELVSSVAGVLKGAPDIVASNVIGSNIANILLIVGLSAMLARTISVSKDIIDLDLPLLGLSTTLLIGVAYDGIISRPESFILLIAYIVYIAYVFTQEDTESEVAHTGSKKIATKDILVLIGGLTLLIVSAMYLIDSVIALSNIFNIATGIISITAVAVGTSLPELIVSIKAALQKKADVALGNIVGSNIFNGLFIVAIPGIFTALPVDSKTLAIGLPMLAITTLLFVISGISKRIYGWEGAFFILIYVVFTGKIMGIL
jgi:cation:H+ antiporter